MSRSAKVRDVRTTGIEITAIHGGRDVHVLGYFFDSANEALGRFLVQQREDRRRRVLTMLELIDRPTAYEDVGHLCKWGMVIHELKNYHAELALMKPTAGSIDGVKVGDPMSRSRIWGRPIDQDEHVYYFRRADLVVALEDDGGTIATLSIRRP